MKKYIFLLFLLCGCVAVFAQQKSTFTVSGQVFDDLDMPVPGASVFIKNSPEWELSRILTVNFL